jgi:starch-binding outer membrane protein, SusD/RagB family
MLVKNRVCYIVAYLLFVGAFISFSSCNKMIEIPAPVTSANVDNVYNNDATATAVMTNVYARLSMNVLSTGSDLTSLSLLAGLSADELDLYSGMTDPSYVNLYRNALANTNALTSGLWGGCYNSIFIVNGAIEGLNNSNGLQDKVKAQLQGEAKFLRALYYFYLVNLYGDVPLVVSTDYKLNAKMERTSKDKIWLQIINDLKDAEQLLSDEYLDVSLTISTTERVRPNKWAAIALLARCYLYTNDYSDAEMLSTELIDNKNMFDTVPLSDVFLKNNKEAIWQLQPVTSGQNTQDALTFIIPPSGFSGTLYPVYLSEKLLNSFEPNDNRRIEWIGTVNAGGIDYYYPYKYKAYELGADVTEYAVVLRLAEQYLIRSEARLRLNKLNDARADLNLVRSRAGLGPTTSTDGDLLDALLHERQIEFFSEWGHRWFDIKRTQKIDVIMPTVTQDKGGSWSADWQLYPIPVSEILADHNLTQNSGY